MEGKVGIITIYGEFNYGNRLQNLAVQTCLARRGFSVVSLVRWRSRVREWLHLGFHILRYIATRNVDSKRTFSFIHFIRKFTPTKFFYSKDCSVSAAIRDYYDYFITGSDQVWNLVMHRETRQIAQAGIYFLTFADDSKKVCISPSIGESRLNDEDAEWVKNALKGYKYLSCREKQGAEEITRITGKPCEWLIDPTLALTSGEWREILDIRPEQREPYIFLFFLDGISEELLAHIKVYAAEKYKIINPSDKKDPYYSIDPGQFVTLLSQAHMIFTDSFHVTAFSINFHVPFYVFNRNRVQGMSSRIESICELCKMQSRYIAEQKLFEIQKDCDFTQADRQLAVEREKFEAYLDKCFKKSDL